MLNSSIASQRYKCVQSTKLQINHINVSRVHNLKVLRVPVMRGCHYFIGNRAPINPWDQLVMLPTSFKRKEKEEIISKSNNMATYKKTSIHQGYYMKALSINILWCTESEQHICPQLNSIVIKKFTSARYTLWILIRPSHILFLLAVTLERFKHFISL